jgi:DNA repair exonuclease SbcCD ATPase subunit
MTADEYQKQIAELREDLRRAKEEAQREGVDAVSVYPPKPEPDRAEELRAEIERLESKQRELVAEYQAAHGPAPAAWR